MMGQKRASLLPLLLLLGFACALSLDAVHAISRTLGSRIHGSPGLDDAYLQFPQVSSARSAAGVPPKAEEELLRGRMDIESNDYPGSGANNRHDPRTPGRG